LIYRSFFGIAIGSGEYAVRGELTASAIEAR
jgi:hypothetical protein